MFCHFGAKTLQNFIILFSGFCYHFIVKFDDIILKIRKFILAKILRRKYYRTGKCNACGKCCTQIYVKHYKHVIQDEKEFEKLQFMHRFYTYLKVIGKDDIGLIFECQNLDKETHRCKIHKTRPGICRRYPQEELFSMGGALRRQNTAKINQFLFRRCSIQQCQKSLPNLQVWRL